MTDASPPARAAFMPINPLAMYRNTIFGVIPRHWLKIRLSVISSVPANKPIHRIVTNDLIFLVIWNCGLTF